MIPLLLSFVSSRLFPYVIAGLAGVALVVSIYLAGVHAERSRKQIADLQEQERFLKEDLARKRETAEKDAKKAQEDADKIARLDETIKDILGELQNSDNQCFTESDTDSLRKLWPEAAAGRTVSHSRRH